MNTPDHYTSLFAAIDAGEQARTVIEARVSAIVTHLKAFIRANEKALSALSEGNLHRQRLTPPFHIPWRCYLDSVELNGITSTIRVRLEETFRGEADHWYLTFPHSHLWATDAELTAIWTADLAALTAKVAADKAALQVEEEQKAREQLAALQARFSS